MKQNFDRRAFLQTAAALTSGALLMRPTQLWASAGANQLSTPSAAKLGWDVGIEMYTFRSISLYQALEPIEKLGVQHIEAGYFLPLDNQRPGLTTSDKLTAAERQELRKRLADHGVRMTNYYSDVNTDREAAIRAFEFAQEMGVQTIVAEPVAEAFDTLEPLCDKYAINLAIHNHPQSPESKYWHPEKVMAVCKNRSQRIGGCCDTGHWVRSGLKPLECLKIMQGRIVSFHLKDVGEWGKPEARDVPLGQGLADYTAVLGELKAQGFKGLMSIEYEHESPQLVDDVAACLAFVEKTAAQLQ